MAKILVRSLLLVTFAGMEVAFVLVFAPAVPQLLARARGLSTPIVVGNELQGYEVWVDDKRVMLVPPRSSRFCGGLAIRKDELGK